MIERSYVQVRHYSCATQVFYVRNCIIRMVRLQFTESAMGGENGETKDSSGGASSSSSVPLTVSVINLHRDHLPERVVWDSNIETPASDLSKSQLVCG